MHLQTARATGVGWKPFLEARHKRSTEIIYHAHDGIFGATLAVGGQDLPGLGIDHARVDCVDVTEAQEAAEDDGVGAEPGTDLHRRLRVDGPAHFQIEVAHRRFDLHTLGDNKSRRLPQTRG